MAAVNAYRATLGLAPVTGIDSSRYNDLDTKISRKFQIKEKTYLELSAQVFNTLGTQNLGTSSGQVSSGGNNTAANSATFGKILGAFNLQQAVIGGPDRLLGADHGSELGPRIPRRRPQGSRGVYRQSIELLP